MDNVCHTLVGAAFGRAGLAGRTRFGSAALMVAANVPDVDVLVFATSVPSVAFRRGWTHGVLAQVVLPLVVTAAFLVFDRRRPLRQAAAGAAGAVAPRANAGWLLALSYLGVYSHVFLDYLNNYGVRLLTPFDWQWFYGDAVFIVDPWLWASLGVGVWFARRRHDVRPARLALALAAVYILAMLGVAQVARRTVADTWARETGRPAAALMVGPVPVVPWTREVIIDAGPEYRTGRFYAISGRTQLDPQAIAKNDGLYDLSAVRQSRDIAAFLVWSRFPFWQAAEGREGREVSVGDMRFRNRTVGGFGARVLVPSTSGQGTPPGQVVPGAR